MSWIGRRLDHLGSAAFGAVGGLVFSQAPAFTQAYLQRLGGHIDEAARTVERMQAGAMLPWLAENGREQAVADLSLRLDELTALRQQLLEIAPLLRPLALVREADWSIVQAAAGEFTPAIPLDPASLLWTLIGVVLAALAWDSLKLPFWLRRHYRRRADKVAANGTGPVKGSQSSPRRKTSASRRPGDAPKAAGAQTNRQTGR